MRTVKLYHGVPSVRSGSHSTFRLAPHDLSGLRHRYRMLRIDGCSRSGARAALLDGIFIGRDSLRNEQP